VGSTPHFFGRQKAGEDGRPRRRGRETLLIDQQEVAHAQGRLHGRRGDAERLYYEGGKKERDDDDLEHGLDGAE
jgi:hypothetical protein